MNTSDLRIGNYVLHSGKMIRVENISKRSINLEYEKDSLTVIKWIPDSDIEPLPISKDLLRKFKFVNSCNYYSFPAYQEKSFFLTRVQNTYNLSLDSIYGNRVVSIKYAHQLQNLMFSMFGIEL